MINQAGLEEGERRYGRTIENSNFCAMCGAKFGDWKSYRQHTLEKHRHDLVLV